jgi:hypothetical protein
MDTRECTQCHSTLLLSQFPKDSRKKLGVGSWCKVCNRARINERNRALRVRVLRHYSGGGEPKCACCGATELEFLSLDHVNGGGRQHRKTIKIRWWEWLRKNNYPIGFRVLCHNCNQSIGIYGYCPHQTNVSRLREAFESYDENTPSKSCKLTEEQVIQIRGEISNGVPQFQLAIKYHVSRATICFINKGKRWADV